MTFIPEKLNIHQAYTYIDNMFGKWFSSSGVTVERFIWFYPNIVNFTSDEILYAMMLTYYNYIIDWLDFKFVDRSGHPKLGDTYEIRIISLFQLKCFLKAAKLSDAEIKKSMETIVQGTGMTRVINEILTAEWKPTMDTFVKEFPSSPFNNKQILTLLKKRTTAKTMFDLNLDAEILTFLDHKISTIINMVKAKKAAVKEAIRREYAEKQAKMEEGHGYIKQLIFSKSSEGEPVNKPILRVKKVEIQTPEQQAIKEKRRLKLLARRAKALKKAREAEGESSPEEETVFKTYKEKFLY
jgi:hypothetical protein